MSPGRLAGRRPPPTPKRVSRGGRTAQPSSNTLASRTASTVPCTVTLSYYYYITVGTIRPHALTRALGWKTKGTVRQRAETPSAHKQNETRPSRERSQRPHSLETATSKLDIWSSKSPSHETRCTLSADSAHAASMAAAAPGPGSPSTSSSSALIRIRVRAGVRVRDRVRARESVRAGARDGVRLDEQQQHRRRVPRLAAQSLHRRRPLVRVRVRVWVRVRVMVGVRVRAGVRVRVGAARPPPSQGPVVACEGDGCVRVIELALGVAVGD